MCTRLYDRAAGGGAAAGRRPDSVIIRTTASTDAARSLPTGGHKAAPLPPATAVQCGNLNERFACEHDFNSSVAKPAPAWCEGVNWLLLRWLLRL
eukprot:SAG31_NODE_536_length_14340_cov_9.449196_11_plen_95_part_00